MSVENGATDRGYRCGCAGLTLMPISNDFFLTHMPETDVSPLHVQYFKHLPIFILFIPG